MKSHTTSSYRLLAAGAMLALAAVSAQAQTTITSLQECLDFALKNNLALRAGNLNVEKAKNLQASAFEIDKTEIALGQDPTSGGSPDNSISLTQSIDFPTVYAARRKYLKAGTELERSNLEVVRNDLVKDVKSSYHELLHVRDRVMILQYQDSICARFRFLADAKYKSGAASRLELINAERLYNENRIALQKEQNAERAALLALQKLLGAEADVAPAERHLLAIASERDYTQPEFAQTPWGSVYDSQKNLSERNLKLARQDYMPSLSVTLKNQLVIKGFNPYDVDRSRFSKGNFMGFEVGVGIPIFFGSTRAKAKAARTEMEIADVERRNAEQAMQKEYAAALSEYRRANEALLYYKGTGVASAHEMAALSQVSYEKGEIDYVEYIQNLRSVNEIHLQYADAVNDYNQAIIMLNYLQGTK